MSPGRAFQWPYPVRAEPLSLKRFLWHIYGRILEEKEGPTGTKPQSQSQFPIILLYLVSRYAVIIHFFLARKVPLKRLPSAHLSFSWYLRSLGLSLPYPHKKIHLLRSYTVLEGKRAPTHQKLKLGSIFTCWHAYLHKDLLVFWLSCECDGIPWSTWTQCCQVVVVWKKARSRQRPCRGDKTGFVNFWATTCRSTGTKEIKRSRRRKRMRRRSGKKSFLSWRNGGGKQRKSIYDDDVFGCFKIRWLHKKEKWRGGL